MQVLSGLTLFRYSFVLLYRWSLLNFVLPQIFDDLDSFQQWFNFEDIDSEGGHNRILSEEHSNQIITKLHAILKPFLLRRMKKDVEKDLPPKKEYVLTSLCTENPVLTVCLDTYFTPL